MVLYFRQLKNLICLFTICSILSIPSLYLSYKAEPLLIPEVSDLSGMSLQMMKFTLGNFGQEGSKSFGFEMDQETIFVELGCFVCHKYEFHV